MKRSVEAVLGPSGILANVLEGYEHRVEQLHMAEEVERAFTERSYLLAEAGTGTGKTLAYLVPAILSGQKVVVSTATKTLQEQIFFKDLPLLREQVGLEFEASYLKGRANYLCLHKLAGFASEPRFTHREEAESWAELRAWADRTETGDRAEVDLPDASPLWRAVSTTAEACLGSACPHFESCFVTRARRAAQSAQLVVVNHHLFFADLAIRAETDGEGVLPDYDAVIFDEAHNLEDAATRFFGSAVSNLRLDDLAHDALDAVKPEDSRAGTVSALTSRVQAEALRYFHEAELRLPELHKGPVRLLPKRLEGLSDERALLAESLRALSAFCQNEQEPELSAIGRRGEEIASELEWVSQAGSLDHVYWAEKRGRAFFLRSAPIEIAQTLREVLYPNVETLVFTSATLRAAGRFDFFRERMGLSPAPERQVKTVAVESPFDFARQAALYLPPRLPEPNAPDFSQKVAEEVCALARVTSGRAFALFTSVRNMEAAHAWASKRLGWNVLLQGESPKPVLLERFRAEPSVLFATYSFWEGVDVPGDALSLVVIDKLPFAVPTDPLVAARTEQLRARGEDAFGAYQLPQAAIALRQGFGRLIRTRTDRGIVAICDRRLTTKGYGQTFLRSLPPARRFSDRAALAEWFADTSGLEQPARVPA